MTKQPYRVTFAFTLDVWATDEDDAQDIVVDQLLNDGFQMMWLEMFGIETDTVDPTHDSWFPINEEDKEDE